MQVIPALVIKDGQCIEGDLQSGSALERSAEDCVKAWAEAGFKRIHLIDLDGVTTGKVENAKLLTRIAKAAKGASLQIRGGVRDEESVQRYLESGIEYLVLGTRAVSSPHFVEDLCLEYPGHILVGLDIRDQRVAVEGWSKLSNHDIEDLANKYQTAGVDGIVYTAVNNKGSVRGADAETAVKLGSEISIPIYVSSDAADDKEADQAVKQFSDCAAGIILRRAGTGRIDLKRLTD